jgi:hypothetical protein
MKLFPSPNARLYPNNPHNTVIKAIIARLCIMVVENIFLADKSAVKQCKSGSGHEKDERRAGQHPRIVSGGFRLSRLLL